MGVLDEVPDLSSVKPDTKRALKGEEAAEYLSGLFALMCGREQAVSGAGAPPSVFVGSSSGDGGAVESGSTSQAASSSSAPLSITALPEGVDAGYIDGLLTGDECACIRALIDTGDVPLTFWKAGGRDDEQARRFRDADTIELHSESFGDLLWERLSTLLHERVLTVTTDESSELAGTWVPSTTNHDVLFAKYPCGGHFAPHTDGNAVIDFNYRSMYSIILFLNTVPDGQGGGTRFYRDEAVHQLAEKDRRWTCDASLATALVSAVEGRLLFFHQGLVHEGVAPAAPHVKYIIRSDVMYRRSPPICDTPTDRAAYALYLEGEALAEAGHVKESIIKMRRAFKMSRELAALMGS
jgi:hypothetical protein